MEETPLDLSKPSFKLNELVASCNLCSFVDKPMVKYRSYIEWLPEKVKVLAIGESPPPGTKESIFYNLSSFDRFRESMKLILGLSGDVEVLKYFKQRGTFVTPSVKCRPQSREEVWTMRKKCTSILEKELKLLKPSRVLAMGRAASTSISEIFRIKPPTILKEAELAIQHLNHMELAFTPHSNYIFRFNRNLASKIKNILTLNDRS